MGHKVHPKSFRLPLTKAWDSIWFSKQKYKAFLQEDVKIRKFLLSELKAALVERVEIERSRDKMTITVYSAKPGIVIGRGGSGITDLVTKIKNTFFRGKAVAININVKEIKEASLAARVVALQIAADIERRMPYRRVMKQTIERVQKARAKGVKVIVAGRLNGADIARTERLSSGTIPLHSLRADIDYGFVVAHTIYGTIGVKVWINRGEVFEK